MSECCLIFGCSAKVLAWAVNDQQAGDVGVAVRKGIRGHRKVVGDVRHPDRFADLAHARAWCAKFVPWYNETHSHSSVGLQHPADVHDSTAAAIREDCQPVLDAAYAAHPERFTRPPTAPRLPAHA